MTKVGQICQAIEEAYPLTLQEHYDNCGLQLGDVNAEVTNILFALDVTESVLQEAIEKNCQMIVSHHPLLFHPLKTIKESKYEERCVRIAIENKIALYAAHTNLDNSLRGLNGLWAHKMGLKECRCIAPQKDLFVKVTVYVPVEHASKIRLAFSKANWGVQGQYDSCSFTYKGEGRFRALPEAQPYCGDIGKLHQEPEEAVSALVPRFCLEEGLKQIRENHPYEEPAIDIFPLEHSDNQYGAGIIGTLEEACTLDMFFEKMKACMPEIKNIAHSHPPESMKEIKRVAYCGGSGAFLWRQAASLGADLFITGEAKYNDFYDVQNILTLATIGHYESEKIALSCLHDVISHKISKFVAKFSERGQNPINYVKK